MSALSDAEFEDVKASLNNAIHELVFACMHADANALDDACTCLVTAQQTIEQVNELLVSKEAA